MKKKNKIIIIKDTRESNNTIYSFQGFPDAIMIRDCLPCGDFSIAQNYYNIFVERKTLPDLVGSFIGDHRQNFKEMWERGRDMPHKFLLIEGNIEDAFAGEYRSSFHPNSLIGSLMSWSLRFGFSWFFVGSPESGEQAVYRLFTNFVRLKKLKQI